MHEELKRIAIRRQRAPKSSARVPFFRRLVSVPLVACTLKRSSSGAQADRNRRNPETESSGKLRKSAVSSPLCCRFRLPLAPKTELKWSSSGSQSEESGDRELRKAPQKCRFLAVLLPVPFAHGNGTDVFVALLLLPTVHVPPNGLAPFLIVTLRLSVSENAAISLICGRISKSRDFFFICEFA